MKKQLNQRQYDFCINYIKNGFNAHDAALSAGYSPTYAKARAHELVNHPTIKEHLKESHNKVIDNLGITYEWKIKVLQQIIGTFMKEPNQLQPQDAKVVIQAISELNQMQGDYAPDKRLSLTIDTTKEKLKEVRRIYKEY